MAKREDVTPFDEFRVKWDTIRADVDDEPNGSDDRTDLGAIRAARENLRDALGITGNQRLMPLMPGGGAAVPGNVLAMFDGGATESD